MKEPRGHIFLFSFGLAKKEMIAEAERLCVGLAPRMAQEVVPWLFRWCGNPGGAPGRWEPCVFVGTWLLI